MKSFRSLIVLLIVIALGVIGAQWLAQEQLREFGEVIVRVGDTDYIASLPQAGLLLVIAFLLLWLIGNVLSFPFRAWGRHRRKQSRARLIEGLVAVHNGQWTRAERQLDAAAQDPDVSVIALIAAVRVADARGDAEALERHLHRLAERDACAHALLQAERHLDRKRPVDAINTLDVAAAQPLPPRGLLLRTEALIQISRADEAYGQLGAIRRQQALQLDAIAALETRLATASLEQASDANALAERWESLPKSLRSEPDVVGTYALRAAALGWDDATLRSLEQALDTRWDENLAALYGRLPMERYDTRRASAQRWLQDHPESAALLLTLARLARHQQQWPQAEDFLHRALTLGAGAEAWEVFGDGYADAGDTLAAQRCYANALRVQRGEQALPLPTQEFSSSPNPQAEVMAQRTDHGFTQSQD
ncbi:heme biosynthesis protein HemY [Xanthomonas albilineans]|uniref:Putative porphyrin biosynthesis protein n=1 Tax=Xanthomonas albilineans (strain GPE PC73 / CFBP 7063) TaxID=380358 RepID=D2UGQ1_XANAP|nr:heme biosynthesis HemY N-terminal domain-containing protein [Xanthomonas albilineans]QHQ29822.1 putative porphyrin biosynthesis protein [Xanthomonas albilineans]CBA17562.1 putative porphyrin biosynthesis protein [Xanthomonas albilineans GPE PC73]